MIINEVMAFLGWYFLLGIIRLTLTALRIIVCIMGKEKSSTRERALVIASSASSKPTATEPNNIKFLVDSGATSACISKDKMGLIKVTNSNPKLKVKVANGAALDVVSIGTLTVENLQGFVINKDGSRNAATTRGTWREVMVVDGLDPKTILLSVRKMRDLDNILTYFNSDNEAKVKDCLRFPTGVYRIRAILSRQVRVHSRDSEAREHQCEWGHHISAAADIAPHAHRIVPCRADQSQSE